MEKQIKKTSLNFESGKSLDSGESNETLDSGESNETLDSGESNETLDSGGSDDRTDSSDDRTDSNETLDSGESNEIEETDFSYFIYENDEPIGDYDTIEEIYGAFLDLFSENTIKCEMKNNIYFYDSHTDSWFKDDIYIPDNCITVPHFETFSKILSENKSYIFTIKSTKIKILSNINEI